MNSREKRRDYLRSITGTVGGRSWIVLRWRELSRLSPGHRLYIGKLLSTIIDEIVAIEFAVA